MVKNWVVNETVTGPTGTLAFWVGAVIVTVGGLPDGAPTEKTMVFVASAFVRSASAVLANTSRT
jgi:hypothetical protein